MKKFLGAVLFTTLGLSSLLIGILVIVAQEESMEVVASILLLIVSLVFFIFTYCTIEED